MIGGILDHVERVQRNVPLYVPPSADWVPYLYPPGYYWVSAFIAQFAPLVYACKGVSLVSTLVSATNVGILARRLGASHFWAALGVGLFFAAYSFTGYWYDIERCDALFVAMLSTSALLLSYESVASTVFAGALLGLSFFVKQPALLFVVCVTGALLVCGASVKRAFAFGVPCAIIMAVGAAALNHASGGWFWFYCFDIPAAHGMALEDWKVTLLPPLLKCLLFELVTLATFGAMARALLRRVTRKADEEDRRTLVFGAWLLAGFVSSVTGLLHPGGAHNVLMFWSTSACAATAVVATRLEANASTRSMPAGAGTSAAILLLVFYQLARFVYSPAAVSPTQEHVDGAALIAGRIQELERRGEVFVEGRGHVSAKRHLHTAAIVDLTVGGFDAPASLVSNIEQRAYAAIVLDKIDALKMRSPKQANVHDLLPNLLRNYFVSERLPDVSYPLIGFGSQPTWVFLPRKTPLAGLSDEALERRARIESTTAEERMQAAPTRVQGDGWDIEDGARWADANTRDVP
ncbi:DUF2029 domain-containing protein [Pendulispora rubella]|uniref:DUF2029 domain-containing protein n=1 Tax=Pendulispora rubella TaxID=2741070 RepID=A0ABZ2L1E0_9BACT